jgi:hypothetical protein
MLVTIGHHVIHNCTLRLMPLSFLKDIPIRHSNIHLLLLRRFVTVIFCRRNFKIVVVLWFDLGSFFRPSFMAVFNFMPGSTVHCSSSFISTHFLISAGNQHFIFKNILYFIFVIPFLSQAYTAELCGEFCKFLLQM